MKLPRMRRNVEGRSNPGRSRITSAVVIFSLPRRFFASVSARRGASSGGAMPR
jgi:hypothetical protein